MSARTEGSSAWRNGINAVMVASPADHVALLLVDHQVGLYSGVRDITVGELKHNVVALAKAASILKIPTVVTTTAADSMWGPTIPELVEVVGREAILDRSTVNA